ncbi:MAG: CBS domain-containing protein, partial [Verrucomicrobiota bacterium]
MTKAFASVPQHYTVKEALDDLRELTEEAELLSRIFVVDNQGKLVGRLRLRDLAFSKWNTPISEFMVYDHISIEVFEDQEEAGQMISRYDLVALPVVDS